MAAEEAFERLLKRETLERASFSPPSESSRLEKMVLNLAEPSRTNLGCLDAA